MPEAFPCSLLSLGRLFVVTGPRFQYTVETPVQALRIPTREALRELSPRPRQGRDASDIPLWLPGLRPRAGPTGWGVRTGPQGSLVGKSLPRPGVSPQWGVGRTGGEVAGSGCSSHCLPSMLPLGLLEAASCLACPRGQGSSSSPSSTSLAPVHSS